MGSMWWYVHLCRVYCQKYFCIFQHQKSTNQEPEPGMESEDVMSGQVPVPTFPFRTHSFSIRCLQCTLCRGVSIWRRSILCIKNWTHRLCAKLVVYCVRTGSAWPAFMWVKKEEREFDEKPVSVDGIASFCSKSTRVLYWAFLSLLQVYCGCCVNQHMLHHSKRQVTRWCCHGCWPLFSVVLCLWLVCHNKVRTKLKSSHKSLNYGLSSSAAWGAYGEGSPNLCLWALSM